MTIPPELLRSIPRDVRLSLAGKAVVAAAVALLAAGVGLGVWLYVLASRPESDRLPAALPPVLFVSLGTAGILLLRFVRGQASLVATGRPAVAVVTGKRKVSHGKTQSNRIDLEFAALSGARVKTHIDLQTRPPNVGSEIVVVYDADTPTRCARYPLGLVRIDDAMTR